MHFILLDLYFNISIVCLLHSGLDIGPYGVCTYSEWTY